MRTDYLEGYLNTTAEALNLTDENLEDDNIIRVGDFTFLSKPCTDHAAGLDVAGQEFLGGI